MIKGAILVNFKPCTKYTGGNKFVCVFVLAGLCHVDVKKTGHDIPIAPSLLFTCI